MGTVIVRAQTAAEFESLHGLLLEYEDSLPADLRHGMPPALPDLPLAYGAANAAFLAVVDGAAAGCVALSGFDASTAVMKIDGQGIE